VRLNHLRMLKMGGDDRANAPNKGLEFGVFGVGIENLIDGIEDLLVIGHLMVHVRAVEVRACEL